MDTIDTGHGSSIEQRLAALERQNRVLRRGWLLLFPLAGLAVLAIVLGQASISCSSEKKAAPAPPSDVLQARRLEILNDKGVAVVVISSDARGSGKLVTSTTDGAQLVQLASTEEGGTIAAAGSQGRLRAAMAVAKGDDGTIFTFDGRNQRLISFSKSPLGDGAVMSYDRVGNIKKMWP
jgi:hypothetical protein